MEQVTVTLPISQTAGWVILTALGIAAATVLVWLTLEESRRDRPRGPLTLLTAFGWAMVPIWLLIFAGTLWQLWAMLTGSASSLTSGGLGAGALIAAVLGAPFVIWGTVLKQRTVDFQKEGHITDRITSAVEQLGAEKTVKVPGKDADGKDITIEQTLPNIEVRIGAILSLERIAQDSTRYDKGRDHVRVMEILCAYIRENSNATPPQDFPEPEWEPLKENPTEEERAAHLEKRQERFGRNFSESKAYKWAQSLRKPRADIAQALLVLGRRTADQRKVEAAWPDPPDRDTEWVFDRPCPELPDIKNGETRDPAQIEAFQKDLADWNRTLRAYSGYRLDLRGASLQRADLSAKRPDQSDAVFSGALFQSAHIEGAFLGNARMEGTNLSNAQMEETILWLARLEGANLSYTRMEGTTFMESRMDGADLSKARMDKTTDWTGVSLSGAAIWSVDFRETTISEDQIKTTFGDGSTKLPEDLHRPTHWPEEELDPWDFDTEYQKWLQNPEAYTPPPPEQSDGQAADD